jgi:transcriptional regulator with XRE-family HTH domain
VDELGKRLKTLRNERGLTLVQLGEQVGLSASHLSQIERGVAMPSLVSLAVIARTLDVEVGHFFEDAVSSHWVVRANQGKRLGWSSETRAELLSADASGKKIQPYRLVCQPGASRDEVPTRQGEEFSFVLKGQLTVTVGEETFVLEAGDSIHCETSQPRSWRNEAQEECIIICAASPPVSEGELAG